MRAANETVFDQTQHPRKNKTNLLHAKYSLWRTHRNSLFESWITLLTLSSDLFSIRARDPPEGLFVTERLQNHVHPPSPCPRENAFPLRSLFAMAPSSEQVIRSYFWKNELFRIWKSICFTKLPFHFSATSHLFICRESKLLIFHD